jgi:hypothetical protein
MLPRVSTALLALSVMSAAPQAQQKSDFSGIWVLDTARSDDRVYGQIRVITQTPSQIEMAVLHFASGLPQAESTGLPRVESRGQISTSISPSFDFKVASAPRGFIPDRHVYTRVTATDDRFFALGDALIRFGRDTGTIALTCATASCTVTDVLAGRRGQSRTLPNGREASLSLHANTLITAVRE